jgi:hypothetical protein
MQIEAYDFGTLTIDGSTFTNDLKIVEGNVVADWWRIEGHRLLVADIEDVVTARPDILVVGTGEPGMMTVSDEVKARLAELGIELIIRPTRQACNEFNRLAGERTDPAKIAFAAHLTC